MKPDSYTENADGTRTYPLHETAVRKLVELSHTREFHALEVISDDGITDTVLWNGNQIAWTDGPCTMLLVMTEEDLENGEIPEEDRVEIRANRDAIEDLIRSAGFEISE